MFAGIDWAADEHAVCVIDDHGRVIDRFTIGHTADGFERLVERLARHGAAADLPIAIERPDGRLVDRLLDAGHPVVPVKTTAIKAWREAEVGSGAKSDPGDARVIAVATEGDVQIERYADDVCWVPDTHEALSPVLAIIPLQLFAYHVAIARGTDVDQPRNLAKSVTVE